MDECKDISIHADVFRFISDMPDEKGKERFADILFELTQRLPTVPGYPYQEPDELDAIRKLPDRLMSGSKKPSLNKIAENTMQ